MKLSKLIGDREAVRKLADEMIEQLDLHLPKDQELLVAKLVELGIHKGINIALRGMAEMLR